MKRYLLAACLIIVAWNIFANAQEAPENPFAGRWLPAPAGGAFRMDEYIIWCGSVIRHDDGRYYMFASLAESAGHVALGDTFGDCAGFF